MVSMSLCVCVVIDNKTDPHAKPGVLCGRLATKARGQDAMIIM